MCKSTLIIAVTVVLLFLFTSQGLAGEKNMSLEVKEKELQADEVSIKIHNAFSLENEKISVYSFLVDGKIELSAGDISYVSGHLSDKNKKKKEIAHELLAFSGNKEGLDAVLNYMLANRDFEYRGNVFSFILIRKCDLSENQKGMIIEIYKSLHRNNCFVQPGIQLMKYLNTMDAYELTKNYFEKYIPGKHPHFRKSGYETDNERFSGVLSYYADPETLQKAIKLLKNPESSAEAVKFLASSGSAVYLPVFKRYLRDKTVLIEANYYGMGVTPELSVSDVACWGALLACRPYCPDCWVGKFYLPGSTVDSNQASMLGSNLDYLIAWFETNECLECFEKARTRVEAFWRSNGKQPPAEIDILLKPYIDDFMAPFRNTPGHAPPLALPTAGSQKIADPASAPQEATPQ